MSEITLTLDDSRRLTGKNLFIDQSGAVLDVFVSGIDKQKVVDTWLKNLQPLLEAFAWSETECFYRIFEDGISLGFAAPIDALYAATDINEAAWKMTKDFLLDDSNDDDDTDDNKDHSELFHSLKDSIKDEQNPALLTLIKASEDKNIAYLVDDDEFSLGLGSTSQSWDIDALPNIDDIIWDSYKTVPTALVTGTNGKSTSVRLSAHILKQAGIQCGVTSTDFIKVGDTIIDKGDYSGPGGARMLLRHNQTEAAVLEVARGGLLRRGLPIPEVDVALVTNVAEDHLGQYGINSVEALTATKMMVAKAATKQLILNADDQNTVKFVTLTQQNIEDSTEKLTNNKNGLNVSKIEQEPLAKYLPEIIVWFSLREDNPVISAARKNSQTVCFLRDEHIIYATPEHETTIIDVKQIPMTLNGAAVHNVQNALGAVALSKALGVDDSDIRDALSQFKSDVDDNPGRGNMFEYRGAKIILDFAHNVHSMDAMAKTLANIPAKRKILMLCHAGDRSDTEIHNMTSSSMAMKPDLVWVCELPNYLRGRELGEVPKIITASILENGLAKECIHYQDNLLKGTEDIIKQLQTDDLVFIMALSDRDEIAALLVE